MASLLVAGADLQRRDDLAVTFQLGLGQNPGDAAVGAVQGFGSGALAQRPVKGTLGDPIQDGGLLHQDPPVATAWRQIGQAAA